MVASSIPKGDLLNIDYNAMEIDMVCPFDCNCGSPNCKGKIAGFSRLSPKVQEEYLKQSMPDDVGVKVAGKPAPLTPFVRSWAKMHRNN